MNSSLASGAIVASLLGLTMRFTPPYFVEQLIVQESAHQESRPFIELPNHPGHLSIFHNHHSLDTAAGACRKERTHYDGQGAFEFRTVSAEMDIPLVCRLEGLSVQRGPAALLTTSWHDKAVPSVPEGAFSYLDENCDRL